MIVRSNNYFYSMGQFRTISITKFRINFGTICLSYECKLDRHNQKLINYKNDFRILDKFTYL